MSSLVMCFKAIATHICYWAGIRAVAHWTLKRKRYTSMARIGIDLVTRMWLVLLIGGVMFALDLKPSRVDTLIMGLVIAVVGILLMVIGLSISGVRISRHYTFGVIRGLSGIFGMIFMFCGIFTSSMSFIEESICNGLAEFCASLAMVLAGLVIIFPPVLAFMFEEYDEKGCKEIQDLLDLNKEAYESESAWKEGLTDEEVGEIEEELDEHAVLEGRSRLR